MSAHAIQPDFFVIGAAKAGTTSLCDLLGAHPEVFMCDPKEPQFFTERFDRGWGWYESLFAGASGFRAVGEGSTTYSEGGIWPQTVDRLARYAPGARILYITRHPLERLESMWIQLRHRGLKVSGDFARALHTWPELIDSGLYWTQIDAYRRRFGDERILLVFLDELRAEPRAQLRRCYVFLGVDPGFDPPDPGRPRNVWSAGKHEDRIALSALRRVPGYDRLRDRLVPRGLRRAVKRFFVKPVRRRPQWDAATHRWVLDRIGGDVARFLEHCGKPADYWSLELPEEARP